MSGAEITDWVHKDDTPCDAGFTARTPQPVVGSRSLTGSTTLPGTLWWCTEHQKHLLPARAVSGSEPTEERPHYSAFRHHTEKATNIWSVAVNEGWRSTVVCSGMYDWAARWLVKELQGKPYAPGERP